MKSEIQKSAKKFFFLLLVFIRIEFSAMSQRWIKHNTFVDISGHPAKVKCLDKNTSTYINWCSIY